MATSYSVPIDAFFHRIETDRGFFNYFNLAEEEAIELATRRATQYLHEACARITLECPNGLDFTDYNDNLEELNGDLNKKEVYILASLMYEMYLNRDIAKLRCLSVNYAPTDLRVFDPSNARKTFMTMYTHVVNENEYLLDWYRSTDRDTGELRDIDFAKLDIDSDDNV